MNFNPILHGLRGMAAMMVLLYHWKESYPAFAGAYRQLPFLGTQWNLFLPVDFGWMGVLWFFVLSGYLLSANLWHKPLSAMEVRHFWERRFARIYPAVWIQLPILLWLTAIVAGPLAVRWESLVGNFVLWVVPFGGGVSPYNAVWWTLPIELGFYLVLPAVLLFYRRLGWPSPCCWWWPSQRPGSSGSSRATKGQLPGFPGPDALPARCAVCLHVRLLHQPPPAPRPASAARGGPWLLLLVLALFYGWIQYLIAHRKTILFEPGLLALNDPILAMLIAAVIALLLRPDMAQSWINRLLSSRPMHWLGELSYGIYLWHYPCLRAMPKLFPGHWGGVENSAFALVACLLFTLPAAALSYFLVERPVLTWLARRQNARRLAATHNAEAPTGSASRLP
ncbi:MAG: acyltransferase [Burkholderiaceae bacterium]